jgi:pimeloyl-ACP methyl ester carboxylesterase
VVIGTEIELPVVNGVLSGVDFGGRGEGVLLVHGSGHNAAAWTDVASHLVSECHPIALDLRGHGQTRLESTRPEQYWRDIGSVVAALSWDRPVLVGHSTGGYAVTAAASGLVEPAALCIVDGVVLDDRNASLAEHAAVRTAEAADRLRSIRHRGRTRRSAVTHLRAQRSRRTSHPRRRTRRIPPGLARVSPCGHCSRPEGALWFTRSQDHRIGRVTTGGEIAEYSLPSPSSEPHGVTVGPDGAVWAALETGGAARLEP